MTQAQLATRVGLSAETVRGYETRQSRPSRQRFEALIETLKIPNALANEMRESAGFAPKHVVFNGEHDLHFYYEREEFDAAVETVPWPEFVVDDALEVVAANTAVQAIWGINFEEERRKRSRAQLNLLSVASDRHFADRVKNWEECVGVLISMMKANRPEPVSFDNPDPYFAQVLNEFLSGDPAFLARLIDVWTKTEARDSKVRWTYPVVWEDPHHGALRFLATVSLANAEHATFFNDWIPVDAASWNALEQIKRRSNR
jgi:transcriptional regulator with XRE-family HTH domain